MKNSFTVSGGGLARWVFLAALIALPSFGANVRLYFQQPFTQDLSTNAMVTWQISSNINAAGGVVPIGLPRRITPATNGLATNFYQIGWYAVSNVSSKAAIVINVYDSSTTLYDYTNLLQSGFNTYAVTVYGTNPAPSFDEVTNALGFLPLTAVQITNVVTNIVATNLFATTNYVATREAAIGLAATNYALAIGLSGTNFTTSVSNSLRTLILTNAENILIVSNAQIASAANLLVLSNGFSAVSNSFTISSNGLLAVSNKLNSVSNNLTVVSDGLTIVSNGLAVSSNGLTSVSNAQLATAASLLILSNGANVVSNGLTVVSNGHAITSNGLTALSNRFTTLSNELITVSNASLALLSEGFVVIVHTNASTEVHIPIVDSDAARGTNLSTAFSNVVSGDSVFIGPGTFLCHTMANILVSNATYKFQNSRITIDGTSTSARGGNFVNWLFLSDQARSDNWKFIGPVTLDGAGIASKVGMVLQNGDNRTIRDVTFTGWADTGLWTLGSAHMINLVESCYFTNCIIGMQMDGEYFRVTDTTAKACTNGFWVGAGNNKFSGCSAIECVTGLKLDKDGSNPGHGSWVGGDINHNTTNVFCTDTFALGFTFVGAHAYSGEIRSAGQGFQWLGGDITGTYSQGALTNNVTFENVVFPQNRHASFTSGSNTYFFGCRTLTNFYDSQIGTNLNVAGTNTALYFSGNGSLLTGISDDVQAQLNRKLDTTNGIATNSFRIKGNLTVDTNANFGSNVFVGGSITATNLTASRVLVSDASKQITNSSVTATELAQLSGVTGLVSTNIDSRLPKTNGVIYGDASTDQDSTFTMNGTVNFSDLDGERVLQMNAAGDVEASVVTTAELLMLSGIGITPVITLLNNKLSTSNSIATNSFTIKGHGSVASNLLVNSLTVTNAQTNNGLIYANAGLRSASDIILTNSTLPVLKLDSALTNGAVGGISFIGNDTLSNRFTYAAIVGNIVSGIDGAESGKLDVTVGSSAPVTIEANTLRVNGGIVFTNSLTAGQTNIATVGNGDNDISPGDYYMVTIVTNDSTPSAAWNLNSISGAWPGKQIRIVNQSGYLMTLKHESLSSGVATNRLRVFGIGSDLVCPTNCIVDGYYDPNVSRWIVSLVGGQTNTVSDTYNGDLATNGYSLIAIPSKTGVTNNLRTLVAGSNIVITTNATNITITATNIPQFFCSTNAGPTNGTSTAETQMLPTGGTGTLTTNLPANFLTLGKQIEIKFSGRVTNEVPNVTLKVYLGGALLISTLLPTDSNPDGCNIRGEYNIACVTNGASGAVIAEGNASRYDAGTDTMLYRTGSPAGDTIAIDTTAVLPLKLTATFSAADSSFIRLNIVRITAY